MGGVVALTQLYRGDDGTLRTGDEERGVFVLQQCGTPGDAAICDQTQPDF